MIYSAALATKAHRQLCDHLLRSDGQEDVCFGLYRPSEGRTRSTGVVSDVILPQNRERVVHGNASFSGSFFLRAVDEAVAQDAGLVLLHSHPKGRGWQGMSADDVEAERRYAAQAFSITGLPFLGMTLAGDELWSARFWERVGRDDYEKRACETVRVVGERLSVTYDEKQRPKPGSRPELERTVSAWGYDAQADLARLKIGVIGAGSVGALIAEALARTGIGDLMLLDFDTIKVVNLDRLLHARKRDAVLARSKVETLRRALVRSATDASPRIEALELSVVEEEGFRAALDCDVLFSCVDRPWPRAALNMIAYAHLIPVIDGGIKVFSAGGSRLTAADWKAHVAAPGRRCLECLGQYDPGLVATERDSLLDDPVYIGGLPPDHPIRGNQNVFAFSMGAASLEVLQLLSMVLAPGGLADTGAQNYHFVTGSIDVDTRECQPYCFYSGDLLSTGDRSGVPVVGRHHAAEQERATRARRASEPKIRVARLLDNLLVRAS
jgi:molybdopterin/thiamine biosynthesis adenylyltransferase